MRKNPMIMPKKCEMCGKEYTPKGNNQKYCNECKIVASRGWKLKYYKKMNPDAKPRRACTDVCCVCGGKFSGMYDGKPYCNKHWLRMYNNGTLEIQKRKSTNQFIIRGDEMEVITANGDRILADAEDYEILKDHSWCVSSQGYAVANIGGKVVKMNRYILGLENCKGKLVDHRNRKKLDNRKKNLRYAPFRGNACNKSIAKNKKLRVLGIVMTPAGKYNVRIVADRKEHHIGNYDSLELAIAARQEAEDRYHGEFASHRSAE